MNPLRVVVSKTTFATSDLFDIRAKFIFERLSTSILYSPSCGISVAKTTGRSSIELVFLHVDRSLKRSESSLTGVSRNRSSQAELLPTDCQKEEPEVEE